jgi:hypothetical protein
MSVHIWVFYGLAENDTMPYQLAGINMSCAKLQD